MKRLLFVSLLLTGYATAQTAPAPAPAAAAGKKELAARVVTLQQAGIETLSRELVERSATQLLQQAGQSLQQVPLEKREAIVQEVNASAKRYVDETVPLVRERALKLAPSVLGNALEERFTEDELRQLLAWLESPVSRKYQQAVPEMQSAIVQKLVAEASPVVDPKLRTLEENMRRALGSPPLSAPAAAPSAAPVPARPASR